MERGVLTKQSGSRPRVAFAYIGPLEYRGRLLKQAATLQQAGLQVEVHLGRSGGGTADFSRFPFPVIPFRVREDIHPAVSFFSQMCYAWVAGRRIARSGARAVVCIGLESLMAGVVAKRGNPRLRLVYDNKELHIESYLKVWKQAVWRSLQQRALARCDAVLHAEANRLQYFVARYAPPRVPQVLLENFPYYWELPPAPPPNGGPGAWRAIYLGMLNAGRDYEAVIQAFAELGPAYQLDLVGWGAPDYRMKIEGLLQANRAGNVRLGGPVPYSDIPRVLARYDVGLAFYDNTNLNNYFCAPNKIYDYLMCRLPVIANDYPGLRQLLEANGVGCCLADLRAESFRQAFLRLAEGRLRDHITDEFRRRHSWEYQAAAYLDLWRTLGVLPAG